MALSPYSTSATGRVLLTSSHLECHFCFLFHSGEPWWLHWVTRLFPSPSCLDPNFICKISLPYNKIIAGCGYVWEDIILAWHIDLVGPHASGEPFTQCFQTQGTHATSLCWQGRHGMNPPSLCCCPRGRIQYFPLRDREEGRAAPLAIVSDRTFGKKRWQLIKIQALHH